MYVAVIMTADGRSMSHNESFSAYVAESKEAAIEQALTYANEYRKERPRRGYYVAVGELTERADMPVTYRLSPLVRELSAAQIRDVNTNG